MRAASFSAPFHDADVGNLAAEVEVQQLEAVLHAVRLELFEPLPDLGHGQAELGAVAARRLPPAAAAGRQLDAHADVRPHAHLAGVLQYQAQLGVLLDHRNDAPAHLLSQHRHLDELGVLEAVADDRRLVRRHRDHRQQLRLGPGLEAEVVGRPKSRTSSTTWRCWFTLMGYTQKYFPSYEFCVMACWKAPWISPRRWRRMSRNRIRIGSRCRAAADDRPAA
jgi:hypothetical protein